MKETAQTEKEMRAARSDWSGWPDSRESLHEYIDSLVDRQHDYGTCVYAMSLAATAAFRYVAGKLGVTGFQASCADMDILRRTRMMNGPFMIIKAEDMLYPQYDIHGKVQEFLDESKGWAKEQAVAKLAASPEAHPNVVARWRELAGPQ